jgi:hypothetical protein
MGVCAGANQHRVDVPVVKQRAVVTGRHRRAVSLRKRLRSFKINIGNPNKSRVRYALRDCARVDLADASGANDTNI